MARTNKTIYRCSACGHESPKWMGKCPSCTGWNTFAEERAEAAAKGPNDKRTFRLPEEVEQKSARAPVKLTEITSKEAVRHPTGIAELDRVLGGGLVPGALILVGGDPGIGKSTLLLSALFAASKNATAPALYVTGEESPEQVKLRADRMSVTSDRVLLFAETRADRIVNALEETSPSVVVIDSVQAIYDPELDSAPGSVTQIREVSARFLYLAKARAIPIFLVGHVTKDGSLAGPRVLEHMVDTVLYFESSTGHPYRILRAHKNRFGSTNEIGVFEMREEGLAEVRNPSELFLAERPVNAAGSVVLAAIEGTRPILVEVQALTAKTSMAMPRRTCLGFDATRAALLVAVIDRVTSSSITMEEVFVNVAGGLTIDEPAADLAVALAIASSYRHRAVPTGLAIFGELGLTGELRAVTQPEARVHEAQKLGFKRVLMPAASAKKLRAPEGVEVLAARTLNEALELVLPS